MNGLPSTFIIRSLLLIACFFFVPCRDVLAENHWRAGLAKLDITPQQSVRLSGYGSRTQPTSVVATPLHTRCLAIQDHSKATHLLIAIETIGLPSEMTREITQRIEQEHKIPRERIVVCSTHTHCAPALGKQLNNIFKEPLNEEEQTAASQYCDYLVSQTLAAANRAIDSLQPANVSFVRGQVNFASNRRVLADGKWTGFGVQKDGPVDHQLPLIKITDREQQLIGLVFNYACHCTTLGGTYNEVNGDWAGYASRILEQSYPGSISLCTIGCGADANPNPRGQLSDAITHGQTLADEIQRLIKEPSDELHGPLVSSFDYASLSFELPTREELTERLTADDPQTQRHAQQQLHVLEQHGRLPATYPLPVQSWKFATQLGMVFVGGEVVVDYAHRLRRELDQPHLWVTAYANDVMGYVPSERMIDEEGYEYSRSGIYYGIPGPWASGTEDALVAKIMDIYLNGGRPRPIAASESLQHLEVPAGYTVELVASEPLIQDPINIAFDPSGDLWVVEMGDYPEKEKGGRIKRLSDTNQDGKYDQSHLFIDELSYPTGVLPWRDGVLISAAPDILRAVDTDHDGAANLVETLFTGFRLANPQHRINGFTYDLDHSVHLASGDNLSEIKSVLKNETINASGRDVQIWPDDGHIKLTSGRSQYVRSRNDWGEWFGNDNSRPLFHFPVEDKYQKRNPHIRLSANLQNSFDPPVAPPIYPLTSTNERFNDLFAASRFTSACSPVIARAPNFGPTETDPNLIAFICEPVHNLVHRSQLKHVGSTYSATRMDVESESEFLRSRDPWFRPVRAAIGPDGCLYIVDMYRETIEHPEWIPESWQNQLDLYAGSDRGRIYRIRPNQSDSRLPNLANCEPAEWIDHLASPIGSRRDMAHRLLAETMNPAMISQLKQQLRITESPHQKVHLAYLLNHSDSLSEQMILSLLRDNHPGVILSALSLGEGKLSPSTETIEVLSSLASHSDSRIALRLALFLGEWRHPSASRLLHAVAVRDDLDQWISQAVACSVNSHATDLLDLLLESHSLEQLTRSSNLISNLLRTSSKQGTRVLERYSQTLSNDRTSNQTKIRFAVQLIKSEGISQIESEIPHLQDLYARAVSLIADNKNAEVERCVAIELTGLGLGDTSSESTLLLDLLQPTTPSTVQQAAVDRFLSINKETSIDQLFTKWSTMTSNLQSHCAGRILERTKTTDQLLTAIEGGSIPFQSLTPSIRQQLTHTGSRSMRVRAQRLNTRHRLSNKRDLIQSYSGVQPDDGNYQKGELLYQKHCSACHSSLEGRDPIGASLENLSKNDRDTLLIAILDPNRAVDPQYHQYLIQLTDGRTIAGRLINETSSSIKIAAADGKQFDVGRDEIETMKNTGLSLMPEGFENILSPSQMQNLIHYLQNKRSTP